MSTARCRICLSEFYVRPVFLRAGWGKFCSRNCKNEGQKTGKTVTCFICGKSIYRQRIALRKSRSKKYFCSKSCQTIWRNSRYVGDKHLNWKGGFSSNSYRGLLKRASNVEACSLCGISDKRVLIAHHIDHNRRNNRVSNLTWLCHNCHILHHRYPTRYRIK